MSIWSRSHSDLAKLARTLQQRNDRTKQRMQQRHAPDGDVKLRRTRSLSPGILSCKERSGSITSEDGTNDLANSSAVGSSLNASLSADLTVDTHHNEHAKSRSESGVLPRITVTSQDTVDDAVSESVSFSAEETLDSVFEHSNSSESTPSTPESVLISPLAKHQPNTKTKEGTAPQKSMPESQSDARHQPNDSALSVNPGTPPKSLTPALSVKGGKNGLRVQSPDLMKTQTSGTSVANGNGAPLSPRLSARSPDLLRKLKEVTFSLGSTKSERAHKREHGTRTSSSDLETKEVTTLPSADKLSEDDHEVCQGQALPDDLQSTVECLEEYSSVSDNGVGGHVTEGAGKVDSGESAKKHDVEVSHRSDQSNSVPNAGKEEDGVQPSAPGVPSLPNGLQQNPVNSLYCQLASENKPEVSVKNILPVPGPLPAATSVEEQPTDSTGNLSSPSLSTVSPISSPAQLRIRDVDLRLVPLSAIGIVVGATGDFYGFQQQDAPAHHSVQSPHKVQSPQTVQSPQSGTSPERTQSSLNTQTPPAVLSSPCIHPEPPQHGQLPERMQSPPSLQSPQDKSQEQPIVAKDDVAHVERTPSQENWGKAETMPSAYQSTDLTVPSSDQSTDQTTSSINQRTDQSVNEATVSGTEDTPVQSTPSLNESLSSLPAVQDNTQSDCINPPCTPPANCASSDSYTEQISPENGGNTDSISDHEQKTDSTQQRECGQNDGSDNPGDSPVLPPDVYTTQNQVTEEGNDTHADSIDKRQSGDAEGVGLPSEDKSLRSSSSGIEADCRHSPSPPDPQAAFETAVELEAKVEAGLEAARNLFTLDSLHLARDCEHRVGCGSSRNLLASASSVFPASPRSHHCVHCYHTRCSRYSGGYSGSGEDDLDTVSASESTATPVSTPRKETFIGLGRLSLKHHLQYKSSLYTDRSDMKESLTLSRSDLCESGTESDRSAVSASVQVSISDVSERNRRSHRHRVKDRDERSSPEDEGSSRDGRSRYRSKRSDRKRDRRAVRSGRYSPKNDRFVVEPVAEHRDSRSLSSSSADSLLSVSDTGSSCAAEVWQYLTHSSSKQGESRHHVSRRRLKNFLKQIQQPVSSAPQEDPGLSDFNKNVAELQELCVSLSRHLEQQRRQQQQDQLQQEKKYLEQIQKLHEQHREQLQQLQQQQLKQQQPQQAVTEASETVQVGKQTSYLSVSLHQKSPVLDIPHVPKNSFPIRHGRISLSELKAQVALDLDQTLVWEEYIERELLGHGNEEADDVKESVTTEKPSTHTPLESPDCVAEDLHTPSESEEAWSNRAEIETERASSGEVCEDDRFAMETPEEAVMKLDEEFDKMLVDMKPHVLQLPHRSDRQKCAVWIKKLCEPPSTGITGRKNRNMYAQLMLHMLKRGNIQGPFDKKPEEGSLQPLPSYMSIYFDEPLDKPDAETDKLPDWVEGELASTIGSSIFRHSDGPGNPAATSTWVSHAGSSHRNTRQRPHTSMGISLDKDPGLSPIRGDFHRSHGYSVDDLSMDRRRSPPRIPSPSDRERRQLPDVKQKRGSPESRVREQNDTEFSRPLGVTAASTTASFAKSNLFHDDTSLAKPSDKEIAVRTKMIEAKYHEEKLRLQQKHDAAVQKILDRKNSEIEDVKSHYRSKTKELEETITKLERKIQTLVKEASVVRETKDKQIMELKKMVESTSDTQRNEFEKRLHDLEASFEQEKFELQKLHTRNIQEILDDTNSRLQRMETEYNQQAASTTTIIKELESRVQQLTGEVDRTLSQRTVLEKDKAELEARLDRATSELEMAQERNMQLEREHQKRLESSEHEMRTLRNKTEASLEFLKQEHTISAAKAADAISDLEQQVEYLKKALKDAEEQRQRQMRETEQVHQQDKLHLENLHDKQVRSMKKELEQLEQEMQRKVSRFEQLLKDKETELQKQKELAKEQSLQAEKALEEFKQQVEKNQNQIYLEMKQQMEQVESDLKKSKQAREKQSREFTRQLEDEKYKHEHEMAEARMTFEQEKSQLLHEVHVQKEYTTTEHERELEQLRESHRNEMKALEFRYKEKHDKEAKVVSELEGQVAELREELVQANQLRKQQLVELGLLREEEKQKMQRDHEAEVARYRADAEQQRLELQKMHSAETERLLEKTNDRLKSIEREYTERGKKSADTITELQATIKQLRADMKRVKENADSKISDVRSQLEEEKQSLKKQYSSNLAMVQHELESQRTRCHNLDRQLQKMEADHEEKVTRLKLEQEERMRGLLPAELKQELEDTIDSLKSQVHTLQQRAAMLQEELDLRLKNPLGPFGSRTSSPIKSSV